LVIIFLLVPCLIFASPKIGFFLLLEIFLGLVNLQEKKKNSFEFYFFKLAKNEIYYYFQEVHFWPCELARPKNALEIIFFFFNFSLFAYSILIF